MFVTALVWLVTISFMIYFGTWFVRRVFGINGIARDFTGIKLRFYTLFGLVILTYLTMLFYAARLI